MQPSSRQRWFVPRRTLRRTLALTAGALASPSAVPPRRKAWRLARWRRGWHGGGGGWYGGSGWHGGGYYRGGWGLDPFWGFGVGLGLAALAAPVYYDQPAYVVVSPPVYYPPADRLRAAGTDVFRATGRARGARADLLSAQRPDRRADRGRSPDCNRWATTQPNAMNDASIFQRATFACMDGRGYTPR